MGTTEPVLLTIEEAAKFLNISRATVYRLVSRGVLEKRKVPKQRGWLIPLKSLEDYHASANVSLSELAMRLLALERKLDQLIQKGNPQEKRARSTREVFELQSELKKRHPELFCD